MASGVKYFNDHLKGLGRTLVTNALLYGEFPVTLKRRGKQVTRPLSAGARMTYLVMISLDWKRQGRIWHTWRTLATLTGVERRTLAEHLQELEAAELIERTEREPGQFGGTVYVFNPIPQKEMWKALHIRKALLSHKGPSGETLPPDLKEDRATILWAFDAWWTHYGRDAVKENRPVPAVYFGKSGRATADVDPPAGDDDSDDEIHF